MARALFLFARLSLVLFLSAASLPAANVIWTNTLGGVWSAGTNWSGGAPPANGDNVFITNTGGYTITLDVNVLLGNLTVGGDHSTQTLANSAQVLTITNLASFGRDTKFNLAGGTLDGSGTVTVNGLLNWTAGTMQGVGQTVISPTGTLALSTGNSKGLYTRTLTLGGSGTWDSGGALGGGGGCNFNIQPGATLDFLSAGDMFYGSGGAFTVNNSGTLRKSAGAGNSLAATLNNSGTIQVQSGVLALTGGGSSSGIFNASAGAELRFGGGVHALTGTPSFSGAGLFRIGITGGELDFDIPLSLGTHWELAINGLLSGTNTITFTGLLDWTGGTMNGTGQTIVSPTGTLALSTGNPKGLYTRTLTLAGNGTWDGGGAFGGGGGCNFNIQPGATLDFLSAGDMFYGSGGSFTVNNSGTLRKSAGPGNSLAATVNSSGTIQVQSGVLALTGGGSSSGIFNASAGAELRFGGGVHALTGTPSFSGAGLFRVGVSGGELDFNTPLILGTHWELAVNGFLSGTNTVTFTGLLDWTGGTMNGTGQTIVSPTGTMALSTGNTKGLYTRTLILAGNGTWDGGGAFGGGGGCNFNIQPGATLDFLSAGDMFYGSGGSFTVNNSGTLRKSAGPGNSLAATVNSSGTIQVQSGVLALTGGGSSSGIFNASAGAELRFGGGVHALTGTPSFSGAGLFRVGVSGGELDFNTPLILGTHWELAVNGFLSGTNTVTFTGQLDWTGGTMNGTGQTIVSPTGTLALSTGNPKGLYTRTLTLAGSGTWDGGGAFGGGGGCNFNIQPGATLDFLSAGDMFYGSGGSFTVNNSGTLRKSAGPGNSLAATVNNNGIIQVQTSVVALTGGGLSSGSFNASAGAEVRFGGGTHALTGATSFGGPGLFRIGVTGGELDFNTPLNLGTHWELAVNGTLSGLETVSFSGQFDWTGGIMNGTGQTSISPAGTLAFSTGNTKGLYTRTLTLAGSGTWDGSGSLGGGGGCNFNIQSGGTLELLSGGDMFYGSGGSFTVTNAGTLRKVAGAANSVAATVFSTGSIQVQSNVLALTGGGLSSGIFNASAGAELRFGGGVHALTGTPSFSGAGLFRIGVTGGELDLNIPLTLGTHWELALNGVLSGTNIVTFTGQLDWTGGIMNGTGQTVITPTGLMALSTGNTKGLYTRTLTLAGNGTWDGGGALGGGGGCNFNIQAGGTLDIRTDAVTFFGSGGTFQVSNRGTLLKSAGSGEFSFGNGITNFGSVRARSGRLSFAAGYVQRSGVTALEGGQVGGGATYLDIQGGSLLGAGNIAADVRNSSDVFPGGPFGFMTVSNNLTQIYSNTAAGRLNLELGGLSPGTNHDQLRVSGQANLAGSLQVDFVNGFVPTPGNSFTVMTYTARSGQFANILSPTGIVLSAVYFPTHLVLNAVTVTQIPPYIIQQPSNVTVREGLTATFHVTAGGTPPLSYQWQRNGVDIPGATSDTLTIANVTFTNAATYRAIVSNFGGVTNSVGALLLVQPGFETVEVDVGVTNVLTGVSFFNGPTGFITTSNGIVRRTTDGGATWTTVNTGMTNITDIEFVGGAIFLSGGGAHTICVSYDGGITWSAAYTGPQHINQMRFFSPTFGIAVGDDGAILLWDGVSWTPQSTGIDSRLLSVDFCGGFPVAVGEAGRIYRFDGTNWVIRLTETNLATFNDVKFCGNGSVGLAVGTGGVIYQTTDCGLNWSSYNNPAPGVTLRSVTFGDCGTWWAAGDNGVLLQSTDGGTSWGTLASGTTNRIRQVVFVDGYGYYVDDGGHLHRYVYTPIPPNPPPVVALVQPVNYFTNYACIPLPLRATAADSNGFVVKVEFFVNGHSLREDPSVPYTAVWTNTEPGTFTFTAVATDNQGATGISTPITVVVIPSPQLRRLIAVGFTTNRAFRMCMTGEAGKDYQIYAHTNLDAPFATWQLLGLMTQANGVWEYLDVNATNYVRRFYRAKEQ